MSGYWATYGYDAREERVAWVDSAEPGIHYTLRGLGNEILREVHELNGSWSFRKDYLYAGKEHIATIDSAGVKHVHKDHLGSTRLVTSAAGSVLSQHNYWPFGEEMTVTSSPERMRFAGHERDLTSFLDYMHARFYAPWGGRFLSVDPGRDYDFHKPQSFNLYAYVRNNPVNAVDQSGRAAVAAIPAWYAGAALVGATSAWLAAPSATHPGKTNAQVLGDSFVSFAHAFAKVWRGRGQLDPDVARLEREKYSRAEQKAERRFGPKQPRDSGPLPPGAPGPHTEIGERPHAQNAPSEVDIWTALAVAETLRQVLVNSVIYQWKTWLSPTEGEKRLEEKAGYDPPKRVVNVTSETATNREEQTNK